MLSIGIRSGKGFDNYSLAKIMATENPTYEYDLLVIGANPGGLVLAKEASLAGKRVGIISRNILSPAEKEGYNEDLVRMAEELGLNEQMQKIFEAELEGIEIPQLIKIKAEENRVEVPKVAPGKSRSKKWSRKVRKSRMDLMNALTNLGAVGRKLIYNAANLSDSLRRAEDFGWKLISEEEQELTLNWSKLADLIQDHLMFQHWKIRKELQEKGIEYIEGPPVFVEEHVLSVPVEDGDVRYMSADIISVALEAKQIFPRDVTGAEDYGITCDDFVRLEEPPGKTLIVGSGAQALECAGVIARLKYPVKVMYKSKILKGYDQQMASMVAESLEEIGVVFMKQMQAVSVKLNKSEDKLQVTYKSWQPNKNTGAPETTAKEEFDTVLFAVGTKVFAEELDLKKFNVKLDLQSKLLAYNEQTQVSHIYSVGDALAGKPENRAAAELAGKLLGKRLFHGHTVNMNYGVIGVSLLLPIEYAFVGLSENGALSRFGAGFIDVYHGYHKPLEFSVPPKKGRCYIKVIVLKRKNLVIGIHLFGPDSGEIIQGFVTAVNCGLTISKLQTTVGVYLTKAMEILKLTEAKVFADHV